MRSKLARNLWDLLIITVGVAIVATAVFFFLLPSHLSVGSITGLAMVISNVVPLPVSVLTFIFNAALLLTSFLVIGRDFGAKTVYTSLLLPVLLGILERAFPEMQSIMGDAFLDMICYIFLVSIGMAILFVRNASSGGIDIVAKLINKFTRMELGKAISLSGMAVALSAGLIYDAKTVVLSVLGTYLNGIVLDYFLFGIDCKRRVCILSPRQEQIKQFILHELHSGATIYEVIGAYTNQTQQEIITVVDKSEFSRLMQYVRKVDPDAFITIYTVNEISYKPKPR